jgi:4-hydroxy-tetrahydrodipicolinate synthase
MSSAYRPAGLLAPVITPFAADGRVDIDALERLGAELLDGGATGLVTLSTTAEPSSAELVRSQGPAAMRAGRALLVAPGMPEAQAAVADVTHAPGDRRVCSPLKR